MFLVTQYFQLVHGYTPLQASLRTLPIAVIMIIVSPLTPRLSARFGAHRTVGVRHVQHLVRVLPARHARRAQPVRVHGGVLRAAHRRHRAHDVADDRVDHVGGAGPARGRGLGDERRDARARCRARHRGARQRRGVALRRPDRAVPPRPHGRPALGGRHLDRGRAAGRGPAARARVDRAHRRIEGRVRERPALRRARRARSSRSSPG